MHEMTPKIGNMSRRDLRLIQAVRAESKAGRSPSLPEVAGHIHVNGFGSAKPAAFEVSMCRETSFRDLEDCGFAAGYRPAVGC
jgi:hypothetical protein